MLLSEIGIAAVSMAVVLFLIAVAIWFFVSKRCENCGRYTINTHNGHYECMSCEWKRLFTNSDQTKTENIAKYNEIRYKIYKDYNCDE